MAVARPATIFSRTNPASPLSIPRAQTALLLLDYQTFTVAQCGQQTTSVLSAANTLRAWARANNAIIVHGIVDILHQDPPSPAFKLSARLAELRQKITPNPKLADEHPDIAPSSSGGEHVFNRAPGLVSALHSPGLKALLEQYSVKSLVLGGLSSSGSVLSTARGAADEGYIVSVIEDACTDPKPEVHEICFNTLFASQMHVCTAEAWVREWEGMKD